MICCSKTGLAGAALAAALMVSPMPVLAGDAGAFIGGMITSSVLRNMRDRTQAEQVQAYNSSRAVNQAPSAPQTSTPQEKLDQLDKLAAGGYITKEEYNTRRQAILNSM